MQVLEQVSFLQQLETVSDHIQLIQSQQSKAANQKLLQHI